MPNISQANKTIAIFIWLFTITSLLLTALFMQESPSIFAFLFTIFLVLLPHAINHKLLLTLIGVASQWLLLIAQLAHFSWLIYVYIGPFYMYDDPYGFGVFLWAGIFSFFVMPILWVISGLLSIDLKSVIKSTDP